MGGSAACAFPHLVVRPWPRRADAGCSATADKIGSHRGRGWCWEQRVVQRLHPCAQEGWGGSRKSCPKLCSEAWAQRGQAAPRDERRAPQPQLSAACRGAALSHPVQGLHCLAQQHERGDSLLLAAWPAAQGKTHHSFSCAFSHPPPPPGSASRRWVDGRLSGAAASPTASPACLTKRAQGMLPFWAECCLLQALCRGKSLMFGDAAEHPQPTAGWGWQGQAAVQLSLLCCPAPGSQKPQGKCSARTSTDLTHVCPLFLSRWDHCGPISLQEELLAACR